MKNKFVLVCLALGLIYFSLSLYRLWLINLPLVSPLDLIESLPPLAPIFNKPGGKIAFGFLPYWNLKLANELTVKPLTHLAYFGIDLTPDGSIKKYDRPGEKEPGWNKLNSDEYAILHRQLKILGKKVILTVLAMETEQIDTLLAGEPNRGKAIDSILTVYTEKEFDGINIDFEYMGYPAEATRKNFTRLVADLTRRCQAIDKKCEISLDVFADSAIKNRLYDLSALGKIVDQIIVMAYDFYRPSSTQSGPVAPLRGKCNRDSKTTPCLDYDVVTSIGDITKFVPSYKIILGVPFYGYEWQTTDASFLANTYPKTGSIATYKRIQGLFGDNKISSLSASWSNLTLTPYLSYIEDDKTYQIHYEDAASLKLKIDFIHQAKMGGLAIWALGYEIPYQELWQTISNNL
ncbi:MAG: glycosyl hydrolase family 18 protein [Patescibacteria group bacterium]